MWRKALSLQYMHVWDLHILFRSYFSDLIHQCVFFYNIGLVITFRNQKYLQKVIYFIHPLPAPPQPMKKNP